MISSACIICNAIENTSLYESYINFSTTSHNRPYVNFIHRKGHMLRKIVGFHPMYIILGDFTLCEKCFDNFKKIFSSTVYSYGISFNKLYNNLNNKNYLKIYNLLEIKICEFIKIRIKELLNRLSSYDGIGFELLSVINLFNLYHIPAELIHNSLNELVLEKYLEQHLVDDKNIYIMTLKPEKIKIFLTCPDVICAQDLDNIIISCTHSGIINLKYIIDSRTISETELSLKVQEEKAVSIAALNPGSYEIKATFSKISEGRSNQLLRLAPSLSDVTEQVSLQVLNPRPKFKIENYFIDLLHSKEICLSSWENFELNEFDIRIENVTIEIMNTSIINHKIFIDANLLINDILRENNIIISFKNSMEYVCSTILKFMLIKVMLPDVFSMGLDNEITIIFPDNINRLIEYNSGWKNSSEIYEGLINTIDGSVKIIVPPTFKQDVLFIKLKDVKNNVETDLTYSVKISEPILKIEMSPTFKGNFMSTTIKGPKFLLDNIKAIISKNNTKDEIITSYERINDELSIIKGLVSESGIYNISIISEIAFKRKGNTTVYIANPMEITFSKKQYGVNELIEISLKYDNKLLPKIITSNAEYYSFYDKKKEIISFTEHSLGKLTAVFSIDTPTHVKISNFMTYENTLQENNSADISIIGARAIESSGDSNPALVREK